jgi:lipoprotein Spr
MKKRNIQAQLYKNILILFLSTLASCSLFKPLPASKQQKTQSPFFDNINITLNPRSSSEVKSNEQVVIGEDNVQADNNYRYVMPGIEYIPPVVFRYAILLDIEVEKLNNRKLVEYVNQWWGVPYRIGGSSMEGIDCSGFVKGLALDAFGVNLPRTSREQADVCKEIDKTDLKEGDLVFFSQGRTISHVGLYISNNKFVHASTSMGVVISDLDEPYWKKRFVKAGRMNP